MTLVVSKTGTKHASATDYYVGFLAVDLRRTA